MKPPCFVRLTVLLTLVFVSGAYADGTYQRTEDRKKTLVWNNDPQPGDAATWSGDRDAEGYASGFGTLTWYTTRPQGGKEAKETLYAYYFGNMARGRLNGPVNGHSKGVTAHTVFKQGKRTSRWAAGPVPSWIAPSPGGQSTAEEVTAAKTETPKAAEFNPPPSRNSVAALERPIPNYNTLQPSPTPAAAEDVPAEGPTGGGDRSNPAVIAAAAKPTPGIDESLRSLARPPASLRAAPPASAGAADSQQDEDGTTGVAQLNKQEVVAVADAEAQKRGYELGNYERPDPLFDPIDKTWSLSYPGKSINGTVQSNKRFTVAIDDKNKKTAIVPGR